MLKAQDMISLDGMWQGILKRKDTYDHQSSTQPYSLSIWVHFLQRREYHADGFKPIGCDITIDGPAVTAGGGTQMGNLLKHLGRFGMVVVSGSSTSVSVGGYISGGGHSILSGKYGLAADSVLQLEMVTPVGEILIANECQNTDLFWAARGVSHWPRDLQESVC
jgi:hypothetical protein